MKKSIFVLALLMSIQLQARDLSALFKESKSQGGKVCFQAAKKDLSHIDLLKRDNEQKQQISSRKIRGLQFKVQTEDGQSGWIEADLRVNGRGYSAYLICQPNESRCFVECDGGSVQLDYLHGVLKLSSEGVRFQDCAGLGKELWLEILQQQEVSLRKSSQRSCR